MIGMMDEGELSKSLKKLSYISSPSYISFLYFLLRGDIDPLFEDEFTMLNMLYYSLYQDTPDVVGFKDPMDFVRYLREHKKGHSEVLDILSTKYVEEKPFKRDLDLGYDCVLDLYSRYSRNEILAAFDYWNWSKRPAMREGVLYLPDKKTDLFFVTLKKTENEYSSTTTYEDYFIDKEQFHWQSQSTTPDTSSVGQRYINHVKIGTQVLLFVREQKMKQGITTPYVFLGKISYVKHEGSKPMNVIWKLDWPVPDEIYAEFERAQGGYSDEGEIEGLDTSVRNVQTSIPQYCVGEGFHPPFSIENSESSDIVEEIREVIEFEVRIIKDKDTLSISVGNAVSTVKKNYLGYTIETQSTLLSQELGLSDKVLTTRNSLKYIQQLVLSQSDPTILLLTRNCTFTSLPLVLEMILGCRVEASPAFDELPAESVWKYSFDRSNMQSSVVEMLPNDVVVGEEGSVETEEEADIQMSGTPTECPDELGEAGCIKVKEVDEGEREEVGGADEIDVVCQSSTENEEGVETDEVEGESFDASTGYPDKPSEKVVFEVKIVKKNDHTLYIYAGNAVATIIKSISGYTIGFQCTILNQDLGLSENVASIRKSLKSTESLLTCSFDSTLLRLGCNCTCPTFPLALELITGCGGDDFPTFDDLPAESVWEYSFDKASQKSSVVMLLPENVGDNVEIGEDNISLPKETILESLSCEEDLPITKDGDSEKINQDTGFENLAVNTDMGSDEGKQSLTADSTNENGLSMVSNYSLSLEEDVLVIKSGEAHARVKKSDGHYTLLRGATFNNSLKSLANHDALKQKQKLIFEGYLTSTFNSLWELRSFDQTYDDLHSIVEMVVGFPCYPNELRAKEAELFSVEGGKLKEERPALNVETSKSIAPIETPWISSVYSWDLVGLSATKHVDKSVINYDGSGIPMEIRPFFKADALNPGDKIILALQYGGKYFAGHIIKEQIMPGMKNPRTRIFWDKDLGDIIREYFKEADGDCIIKFYKTESYKNTYVLDFFIIDSSLLLDEVKKQDSLVKITKRYTVIPQIVIEYGNISAKFTYYPKGNYYVLHSGSVISSVIVPPTKLGEPDKRRLIREKKLISRHTNPRLLAVNDSIKYSSLNEILSNIFGIQCSVPYPNPLALPVKGMYRLPNLELVEDSITTTRFKNAESCEKVESITEDLVGEIEDTIREFKLEKTDVQNRSNIVIPSRERIVSSFDPYKEAVLENDVLIKRIDNPLLNNNLFVIPIDILSFFNAENLLKGEIKYITLTYHSQYFKATVYKKDTTRGIHNKATILNWDESFKAKIKENIVDNKNMPLLMITQSFVNEDEYDVEIKIVE